MTILFISFFYFIYLRNTKNSKSNKLKSQNLSKKQEIISLIESKCQRQNLFGDIANLANNIVSALSAKKKLSYKILQNKHPELFQIKTNKLYANNNNSNYANEENIKNAVEQLTLHLPDISSETLQKIFFLSLKKTSEGALQINKNAISAIFYIEEIMAEESAILQKNVVKKFEECCSRIIMMVTMYFENKNLEMTIDLWAIMEDLVISINKNIKNINLIMEDTNLINYENIFVAFFDVLDVFKNEIKYVLENIESKEEIENIFMNQSKLPSLYKNTNVFEYLKIKFEKMFAEFKNSIKEILKQFFKNKISKDSTKMDNIIDSEIKNIKVTIDEIIHDEFDIIESKIVNVVDEMIDDAKKTVKETINTIFKEAESAQELIIEQKAENIGSEILKNARKIVSDFI
ncbi:hypothetical protein GVAV_003039 [Gurleya vavrai]